MMLCTGILRFGRLAKNIQKNSFRHINGPTATAVENLFNPPQDALQGFGLDLEKKAAASY